MLPALQLRQLGTTLGGCSASGSANTSELARIALLSSPRFRLRYSIDTSQMRPDGSLLRSNRMARLEAALIITRSASASRLARVARLVDAAEVHQLTALLNASYDRCLSAFRIQQTAVGYQLLTRPALAGWLDRLHQRQNRMKLSQPVQETLTIIAYQQPVTRADVEAVRGVQSTDLIRQLIDRGLIRVAGEDDSLGRPFLYATTRAFLDMFGLRRLEDLPDYASLCRSAHERASSDAGTGLSATVDTRDDVTEDAKPFSENEPPDSADHSKAA
jgi:segregation and condensation protein B